MRMHDAKPESAERTNPQSDRKILLLGVGGAGTSILRNIRTNILMTDLDVKVGFINDAPVYEDSNLMVHDPTGISEDEVMTKLGKVICRNDIVITVSGLGGRSGYQGSKGLGKLCIEKDVYSHGIFVQPFKEEKVRFSRSSGQWSHLKKLYSNCVLMKNSSLGSSNRNVPFTHAMHLGDLAIFALLKNIMVYNEAFSFSNMKGPWENQRVPLGKDLDLGLQ